MQSPKKRTNALIHETSPYLLQHAHNPANWYPWGSEEFEKAKEEDKPVHQHRLIRRVIGAT